MRTKKQILEHLNSAGYKKSEISKIMGFLIGNGTKTAHEAIHYRLGNGTFEDFFTWYQSEEPEPEVDSCPVCTMFRHLFNAMETAEASGDNKTLGHLDELMDVMLDMFIEDVTECNDNE